MAEMVLNTSSLPEPLLRMIRTKRVKVREADGEIRLTPIMEGCPLRGMFADGKLSADKFMANKQAEKELEL